jgi:glutamyl/glutaminyl-tRNA synthetase
LAIGKKTNNNMGETSNLVEKIMEGDILIQTYKKGTATRFPPEPNGYMHLRHGNHSV